MEMQSLKRSIRRPMVALSIRLLARCNYEVKKRETVSIKFQAVKTVQDQHLYTQWAPRGPVFCPWLGAAPFQKFYEGVEEHTSVTPDRCYFVATLAKYAANLPGVFAECGVYRGGTALLLSRVLKGTGKSLHLFDSFEGLPALSTHDNPQWWRPGQFALPSVESVRQLLHEFSDVSIHQGWIPDTFQGLESLRFAFAHVDVDLYQSALDCCTYLYPRLIPGGILLFDEYGCPSAEGERTAVDSFFKDKPEPVIVLPTGQAMVIKLGQGC